MGKSALKAVLAMQLPVFPSKGGQPPYTRSKTTIHTSAKLIAHKNCVGNALRGKKFADRAAVQKAFSKVSKECADIKIKKGKLTKHMNAWICYLQRCTTETDLNYIDCAADENRAKREYYPKRDFFESEALKGCP